MKDTLSKSQDPGNPNSPPDQRGGNQPHEHRPLPAGASGRTSPIKAGKKLRFVAFMGAMTPLILLGISLLLTPSPNGIGTHQQLGLPPCSTRVIFGIPCPACGMTTSWAHFVRGQWVQSAQANPGGLALAAYSLVFAIFSAKIAFRGFWPSAGVQNWMTLSLVLIAAGTVACWVGKVWFW